MGECLSTLCHVYISSQDVTYIIKSLKLNKAWKLANVTPIYKSKDSNIMNNYRPISLLSCLGKVFEHLFNYLRDHKLISIHQSGFTPGDCTTNQLVSMYHEVCTALENQNNIQLIFLDISKAFDKVWHKGLKVLCINLNLLA